MKHTYFGEQLLDNYNIILLVPSIKKDEIQKIYFNKNFHNINDVLVLDLHINKEKKKTPMKEIKEYISSELVPVFKEIKPQILLVADSDYFKAITGLSKAEPYLGYAIDSNPSYGSYKVIYIPNYRQRFYDPIKIDKAIGQSINALNGLLTGSYNDPGRGIIKNSYYPKTVEEIKQSLDLLLKMNVPLTIDIECFDLKHVNAGIGSISFAWNKHEGIAFLVDCEPIEGTTSAPYTKRIINNDIRKLLIDFFLKFKNKAIYHNISFDVYILIYQFFMEDIIDTEGLLYGLEVMLRNWDDTKLITYLATNSCAGNDLSLKHQAQEFAGNYAVDEIKDITKIPVEKLLEYNLVDALSTWYTYEKNHPIMIQDQQEDIYINIFKPAIVDIIQMQLTGLPINMNRVKQVKSLLEIDEQDALNRINSSSLVQEFTYLLNENYVNKMNSKWKKKRITVEECNEVFNPNSPNQLQSLLYESIGLPVIAYTDTKQPSADQDTLEALKNHTKDNKVIELLDALLDFKSVNKILTTFIPAFLNASLGSDKWHYLFCKYNIGGTVSGRQSSNDPNLTTTPSNSKYAKLIKSCIECPYGWIFIGADFNALEARIGALIPKDPAKLKIYTDGYDSHSYNTYGYWSNKMPDIRILQESDDKKVYIGYIGSEELYLIEDEINLHKLDDLKEITITEFNVLNINSIQKKYKSLRQDSKQCTFALQYDGTWVTLHKNAGFPENEAKEIVSNYKKLYKVSVKDIEDKLNKASKDGYVTAAFGLRVRTPLLHQVIRGSKVTPYQAEAEGRTAGNAISQSWCMLNTRAYSEFMYKVRKSKYRLDIKPCSQIHDAGYLMIRDNIDILHYTNINYIKAMEWQDHPDIYHDEVKLGGELDVFYPSWAEGFTIKNNASPNEILSTIDKYVNDYNEKYNKENK